MAIGTYMAGAGARAENKKFRLRNTGKKGFPHGFQLPVPDNPCIVSEVEHAEDGPKDGEDKGGGELRGRHAAAAVLPGLSQ